MQPPRSRIRLLISVSTLVLAAACGTDSTSENSTAALRVAPLVPADSLPSVALVAPAVARTLRCDGNAGGRRYSYYSVTAQVNGTAAPTSILSFPTYTPTAPTSFRAKAAVVTNYPGFPGYKVWNVTGHANGMGTPGDLYYLLLPPRVPGPGVTFNAELHILFNQGAYGWWQVISTCTVS